tara:strand:- start:128 stop:415 length:288 start_codon:yes stop_codon:yes gene_type:complete
MKNRPKTDQERAKDVQDIEQATRKIHAEAYNLVEEFRNELFDRDFDIEQVPVGVVSKMTQLNTASIDRLKLRHSQEMVGDKFEANVTWEGVYNET